MGSLLGSMSQPALSKDASLQEGLQQEPMLRPTPYIPKDLLSSRYHAARKRLFFFDYDGTLAPIVQTPSMAVPSRGTLAALEGLAADPRNVVYVISGRDAAFLETHLGHLARVGFSAEHGAFMREPGVDRPWIDFTARLDMGWMDEVEKVFQHYTELTEGSNIELKKTSITWHYRASDPEWGLSQCKECHKYLEKNLADKPIEISLGKKNLEVTPLAVNKGEIVKRLLYHNPDADFIFCAGDDKTDEDMFRALLFNSTTTGTNANATMDAPLAVTLLESSSPSSSSFPPVQLAIHPESVFTTAVGESSKPTLARWHVHAPEEVVECMLGLVAVRSPL
ncbi:trehalose-phosphatase-domain-containing protein [Mycena polygramma]|nr:trehalose-phosphatase-domain-containing protein [Mycena polygramma]